MANDLREWNYPACSRPAVRCEKGLVYYLMSQISVVRERWLAGDFTIQKEGFKEEEPRSTEFNGPQDQKTGVEDVQATTQDTDLDPFLELQRDDTLNVEEDDFQFDDIVPI
jgi:hypothetical protein